ncbi:FAD-dependent oxidoreductase, partial [Raoultella planticola]|uniref:FAD-dependent oxidoreductase n=3 Tax=Pseudomonadota TaxID=1224 RepID=UPI0013D22A9F
LGLDDESTSGLLVGLVDAKRLAAAQALLQRWQTLGLAVELLGPQQAREREPGLSDQAALVGALALPGGGTGNPRL